MHRLLLVLILLGIACMVAFPANAQSTADPVVCPNSNGEFYQPYAFPRFTNLDNRLVLADLRTGDEIGVLAESLPSRYNFFWSPNCRYLVGRAFDQCNPAIILWDATTRERLTSTNQPCQDFGARDMGIYWRDDSSAVVLTGWANSGGLYNPSLPYTILYPELRNAVPIQNNIRAYWYDWNDPNSANFLWDEQRSVLWIGSGGGVTAYHVDTGELTFDFTNVPIDTDFYRYRQTSSFLTLSADTRLAAVYGQRDFFSRESPAMTIYDIASGVGTPLNVERNGAGVVAISPDNRYVVMAFTAVRVWDLTALPAEPLDRLPIRRFDFEGDRAAAIRFIDNVTVEVTTQAGTVSRYNVETGARVD